MNATHIDLTGLSLLLPDKPDAERDSVADAWVAAGGDAIRIGRFWDPPAADPRTVRVYGSANFCMILQQKLGFALVSPDDDLIFSVPQQYLRRRVTRELLGTSGDLTFPLFVKPLVPKLFAARVYTARADLEEECRGLAGDTVLIVSQPVTFTAEARCFALHGAILDCAVYEGADDPAPAAALAAAALNAITAPTRDGWCLLEFNAAWGAGLNGCDARRILPCIAAASGPTDAAG